METTAKVVNRAFKRSYDGKFGTQYVFTVEMDNGDKGEFISSKENPSSFNPGSEQAYTKEVTQNGQYTNVKLKPVKENNFGGGNFGGAKSSGKKDIYVQSLILAQSSFAKAVDLVCAGKITIEQMQGAAEKLMTQQIESALKFKDRLKEEIEKQ